MLILAVGGIVHMASRTERLAQVSPTSDGGIFTPSALPIGNGTPSASPMVSTWGERLRNVLAFPSGSDWKTYKNEMFGFEMKYPPQWTYKISKNQYCVTTVIFSREFSGSPQSQGRELVLNVQKKDINRYLEEIGQSSSQKRPTAEFTINNVNWTLLDPDAEQVLLDLYASHSGTIFTFTNDFGAVSYNIMTGMIGSFRFTGTAK
jgi:hypothetical protein